MTVGGLLLSIGRASLSELDIVCEEKLAGANNPLVSVIIATYNWSSVLHCAVESVLLQTFKEFEVLVIGDGCTDDSEQVVLSFGDERVRWINLPTNSGTQATPNNMGLKLARGRYIAYLGHDDIWLPTHLASLIETIQNKQGDIAGAVVALYGPPTSGAMGVTGVFALGEYSDRDFLPPSSILHKRSLVESIGGWNESLLLPIPTDADFLRRALNADGKIVSSGELTVIKFNAAWRRNAYSTRSAHEQEELLARVRSGVDVRLSTMMDLIRSFVADKYYRIEAPQTGGPGEWYRYNARYKGTLKAGLPLLRIKQRTRFYLDDQLGGFEWYPPELSEQWKSSRWSGPSLVSTLEFPVTRPEGLSMLIHVVGHFQQDIATDVQVLANDVELDVSFESTDEGTLLLSAILPGCSAEEEPSGPLRLTFRVARTRRPLDLGMSQDRRWLGIAVNWVEVAPVGTSDDAAGTIGEAYDRLPHAPSQNKQRANT